MFRMQNHTACDSGGCPLHFERFLGLEGHPGRTLPQCVPFVVVFNIYLAVRGLSCDTLSLQSSLQHGGSLVEACGL